MRQDKLLNKVLMGTSDRNIKFNDLRKLLSRYGFKVRIKGSHHIFSKEAIPEIINIQPSRDGNAKPYQVKQVRNLFLRYKFHLKETT